MGGELAVDDHQRGSGGHAELARPYFTRQAQYGRRVIFRWDLSDAGPANPLTQPWPALDELIEAVEFADEEAARRFDLDRAVGPSGRQPGGDVPDALPCVEFFSWAEAERWLRAPEAGTRRGGA